MKKYLAIVVLMLSACGTSGPAGDYHPYLAKKGVYSVTPTNIPHCHGYGCRLKTRTTLTQGEWKQISRSFKSGRNARQERDAIASAIGQMEKIIGGKTGTGEDIEGTYRQLGDFQHDCVDESINTTAYLDLLGQKDLLKHHDVSNIATRIPLIGGGMGFHQTAVIVERGAHRRYAVDSWFHDNGYNAEVVPLDEWLHGWHPEN